MLGIGVDSGGTHTTFSLVRDGVTLEAQGNETSDSISNARGAGSLQATVAWIMRTIAAQDDDEICAWIGAAGFNGAAASYVIEAFTPYIEQARDAGRRWEIFIANDGVSLLKAPPLFGRGIAAIIGTGSVVMGAHPLCPDGVVKRSGAEWLVSDEGSGVWMTLLAVRMVLQDIQQQGSDGYHSALLDRLCDYFGVEGSLLTDVSATHKALGRAELLAHKISEGRLDAKRRLAGFVYPHLFDLAGLAAGRTHDRIASEVIAASVRQIADHVEAVSEVLAAYTADSPNDRERLPLVVGGNIAANPLYEQQLRAAVSGCKYVGSLEVVGDAADLFARLAAHYAEAPSREQRAIARSFDSLHPVVQLL